MTPRTRVATGMVAMSLVAALALQTAVADGPKGTATIKGKVTAAQPMKPKALPAMNSDPFCATANPKAVPDDSTIVYSKQGNAVPFAFVYVSNIKDKYDAPSTPVVLDQVNCLYQPHVFGMIAGQQIDIKNSDATAHNVHSLPEKNAQFNIAQPNKGIISRKGGETFTRPEMGVKIKCDVHNWMSAWCHVMSHPFFDVSKDHVSLPGKDAAGKELPENAAKWGTYEIKNLPAGEYEIVAWHERFGEVKEKVTVKDGETKELNLSFAKAAAAAPVAPTRTVTLSMVRDAGQLSSGPAAKSACCAKEPAK